MFSPYSRCESQKLIIGQIFKFLLGTSFFVFVFMSEENLKAKRLCLPSLSTDFFSTVMNIIIPSWQTLIRVKGDGCQRGQHGRPGMELPLKCELNWNEKCNLPHDDVGRFGDKGHVILTDAQMHEFCCWCCF